MKFPFLFKRKEGVKLYLGVYFHEQGGVVMLIHRKNGSVYLVDKEEFVFSNSWDTVTEDLDNAFSMLEKRNEGSAGDTIFFVNSNLIDPETKQINRVYLHKIKSAVKNLDLKALGFIEAYEGIVRILTERDTIPPSATIVEVDVSDMTVFVIKSGRLVSCQTVARTDNQLEDLGSVFYQVKGDTVLPSKVTVYSTQDISELVNHLSSHGWHDTVFIQHPKVEVVSLADLLDSLVHVFGTQLLSPVGETVDEEEQEISKTIPPVVSAPQLTAASAAVESDVEQVNNGDPVYADMGGTINNSSFDHESRDDLQPEPRLARTVPPADDAVSLMGFKLNGDVTEGEEVEPGVEESAHQSKKFALPHLSLPRFSLRRGVVPKILVVIVLLGIFAVAIAANEYYLHTAQVVVYLPSEKVGDTVSYSGTPQTESGEVRIATKSSEFTVSTPATGKKDIGDKAKGTVTIHNFDDKERTFAKGTSIAAGSIKFVLNGDVKVASASIAADGSAKLPGKTNVEVTAAEIGDESNLAKAQQFRIEDLPISTYFARNDEAMSGGSKKTLTVVSKKDIDTLRTKVLLDAAKKEDVKGSASAQLSSLAEQEIESSKYSSQAGDEAKTITLKATVATVSYRIADDEMKRYLAEELRDKVEAGKVLQPDKIIYTIQKASKKGSTVTIVMSVNAVSVKAVDTNKVKRSLPGVKRSDLDKTIMGQYGAQRYDIDMKQPIPFLNTFMPLFEKNISVRISYL